MTPLVALISGIVLVVVVVVLVATIKSLIVITPPNRAAVLTGRNRLLADGQQVGYRSISGGRVFSAQAGIIDVFIFLTYFIVPTGLFGRTVGKWVAGISVVDDQGEKPGIALAIPREAVGRFVSAITFGIGLIWVIFDDRRQGWHDKIAGTYVVIVPNSGGPGLLARMFAPQDENKREQNRQQRVGQRATNRRRRNRRRN